MIKKVAAVVVTYNRKKLLVRCLDAIIKQSRKPDILFIIDNLSDDGTPQLLLDNKLINDIPSENPVENEFIKSEIVSSDGQNIKLVYIRKAENDGGAGGFYEGLKSAFESGADWIWLMDDDGIPEKNQLKKLISGANSNLVDFANALVVNEKKKEELAFGLKKYKRVDEINRELIIDHANPFNGTLLTRDLVKNIGLIKKEMFIWGDETEYMSRAWKYNYTIATITRAIHYHPASKTVFEEVLPGFNKLKVEIKPENRKKIFYRNKGFNIFTYKGVTSSIWIYVKYVSYYIVRFNLKGLRVFHKSFMSGIKNKF